MRRYRHDPEAQLLQKWHREDERGPWVPYIDIELGLSLAKAFRAIAEWRGPGRFNDYMAELHALWP